MTVGIFPTAGHPIVLGEWLGAGPGAPTVLVYGHYDVQPAEPLGLWTSPPFEPAVRDGNLYARGAVDDKGQVWLHLKAFEAHMALAGRPPVNVKMLLEGEEEVGSDDLAHFLAPAAGRGSTPTSVVVCDSAMFGTDIPSSPTACAASPYPQIEVDGARGRTSTPALRRRGATTRRTPSATIIAGLKDADGRCTVPGFYDAVRPNSPTRSARVMQQLPFDEGSPRRGRRPRAPAASQGYSPRAHRPAADARRQRDVVAATSARAAKTVLPAGPAPRSRMRLVPDQDPGTLSAAVRGLGARAGAGGRSR